MAIHRACKVWAADLRCGRRSHHSIVDFFLGLLGAYFSVIGWRESKSDCIFGMYTRCRFQNTRNFFLWGFCGVFHWILLATTSFWKNRDLLWEFWVGEFLAKIMICIVWCSNARVMIVMLFPLILRENSSKILRKFPSPGCAFRISRTCSTYRVYTLCISLFPYSHYNVRCMVYNSDVLLRM